MPPPRPAPRRRRLVAAPYCASWRLALRGGHRAGPESKAPLSCWHDRSRARRRADPARQRAAPVRRIRPGHRQAPRCGDACAASSDASPSGCRSNPATGARSRAARAKSASGWRANSSSYATSLPAGWTSATTMDAHRPVPPAYARCEAPDPNDSALPQGRRRALHRRPRADLLPAPPAARAHAAARPAWRGAHDRGHAAPGGQGKERRSRPSPRDDALDLWRRTQTGVAPLKQKKR